MNFKKLRRMITMEGNGQTRTREFQVSSFIHLHLSVCGLVELHPSVDEKVLVETDDNMFNFIHVENSGKTLFINTAPGLGKLAFSNLRVKVFFRLIRKLHVYTENGKVVTADPIIITTPLEIKLQGSATCDLAINAPVLHAIIQNKGDVTLRGSCSQTYLRTETEGNLFARELNNEDLILKSAAQGNIEVNASKTISISHYGEGYVHYYGSAELIHIDQKGEGIVKHINKKQT